MENKYFDRLANVFYFLNLTFKVLFSPLTVIDKVIRFFVFTFFTLISWVG